MSTQSSEENTVLTRDVEQKILTFGKWLKSEKARFAVIVSSLSTVSLMITLGLEFLEIDKLSILKKLNLDNKDLQVISHSIHLTFIVVVLIYLLFGKYFRFDVSEKAINKESTNKEKYILKNLEAFETKQDFDSKEVSDDTHKEWVNFKKNTNTAIKQFFYAWILCWAGWALLYLALILLSDTVSEGNTDNSGIMRYKSVIVSAFNNFSSLMILLMFFTLRVRTVQNSFLFFFSIVALVIILSIAIASGALNAYPVPYFIFTLLSGFLASISMALFFGSLNSFFIRIPIGIIICLHIYAALQVLIIFELDTMEKFLGGTLDKVAKQRINILMTCVYATAFLLKVLLFFVVRWILQTVRLTFSVVHKKSAHNANEEEKPLKAFAETMQFEQVSIQD
ncbi:MAG TPA: hypothetical protein VK400_08025 [Pyrinomonadaceae bacterium]|nr:hypothetical protein [Pyrinomonadaceae bacterium]